MQESVSGAAAGVMRYLEAVAVHDWEAAEACLSAGVRRTGPFGDVYEGRERYLAFLRQLMPTLAGYRMDIERALPAGDGGTVVAQLTETVELGGKVVVTPESLIFEVDDDGRIREIRIYIQQLS